MRYLLLTKLKLIFYNKVHVDNCLRKLPWPDRPGKRKGYKMYCQFCQTEQEIACGSTFPFVMPDGREIAAGEEGKVEKWVIARRDELACGHIYIKRTLIRRATEGRTDPYADIGLFFNPLTSDFILTQVSFKEWDSRRRIDVQTNSDLRRFLSSFEATDRIKAMMSRIYTIGGATNLFDFMNQILPSFEIKPWNVVRAKMMLLAITLMPQTSRTFDNHRAVRDQIRSLKRERPLDMLLRVSA
jgi:hypothetical protein